MPPSATSPARIAPSPPRGARKRVPPAAGAAPQRTAAVEPLEDRRLFSTVHFAIDPQQGAQPISRFIYGVNQSLGGPLSNLTLTRAGGNRWTAYNWENNASNAGQDYQYQNDAYLGGGSTPGGALIPTLQNASANNAGALITVPINGYVAADTLGNGDVRYLNGQPDPNYLQNRFRQELARKPASAGPFTLTPSTTDAYVYQDEFVNWVKTNYGYGQTDPNRPIWFELDNEPDLWPGTHPEVHPAATTYAEMAQKSIDYASAIKAVEPNTMVFGPVNYGWEGYINLQNAPDANGRDFQSWYLQQMAAAEKTYGHRILDSLDVHWYPEATSGGVRIDGQETTPAVVAARLQAPRSLWDPTYTETSWITQDSTHGPIDLIPRLQTKISQNYPGTKLSFGEYNYGAGADISGGLAEADVLGVFGRQGVFSADEWPLASSEPFIAGAFAMFRNFDGKNGAFGDTSVSATTDDVADSSIYASTDSARPGQITLVAINKTASPLPAVLQLSHVAAGATADVYQLTSAGATPKSAGRLTVADPSQFAYTMPAYSVSTLRINVTPAARAMTVGDGSAQRSEVKNLTVAFNTPVTLQAGAITLSQRQPGPAGGAVPLAVSNPSGDGLTFLVTFSGASGPALDYGSLPNGVYDLTVHAALVTNAAGQGPAADAAFTFHRLFGDVDGDKNVTNLDYAAFRNTYGTGGSSPAFNAAFDFDGDGNITNLDYAAFRNTYGTSVSYAAPAVTGTAVATSAASHRPARPARRGRPAVVRTEQLSVLSGEAGFSSVPFTETGGPPGPLDTSTVKTPRRPRASLRDID